MSYPRFADAPDIARENVTATVKWFNASKGFGFVAPTDGSPDAFLHISVLQRAGLASVAQGATIICDLSNGPKGMQVAGILEIDQATATEPAVPAGGVDGPVEGTVKFFNAERGFGFVINDDGGKEVFVGLRAVEQSGLAALEPGQRVRLDVRMGKKGPMADRVELLA